MVMKNITINLTNFFLVDPFYVEYDYDYGHTNEYEDAADYLGYLIVQIQKDMSPKIYHS
jgi:hypothetical protein